MAWQPSIERYPAASVNSREPPHSMTMPTRTLGHRRPPPFGVLRPPSDNERAWVAAMASRLTRVPKGVFRYASHAEANDEWERWLAAAITGAAQID
jgi:hypothetical protein